MIIWAIVGILATIFLLRSCTIVPAGNIKVVDFMGSVSKRPLEPGPRIVNPLANKITMDTRVIEVKEHMETPTSEGLTATVDISQNVRGLRREVLQTLRRSSQKVLRHLTCSGDSLRLWKKQRKVQVQHFGYLTDRI